MKGLPLQLSHVHSNVETKANTANTGAATMLQLSHVHSNVETDLSREARARNLCFN